MKILKAGIKSSPKNKTSGLLELVVKFYFTSRKKLKLLTITVTNILNIVFTRNAKLFLFTPGLRSPTVSSRRLATPG